MVAVLSTLAIQLAVVLGAAVVTASLMTARAGRVLNPVGVTCGSIAAHWRVQ